MSPSNASGLDDADMRMLAQMSLDEEGKNESQAAGEVSIEKHRGRNDFLDIQSPKARSSSLPSPFRSEWNSWLPHTESRLYRYKPLLNKGDFRLLSISKSENGQLHFQMTRQRMDDCPPHQAISYTWGSTERTEQIFHLFTGERLYITENCASALSNLFTNSEQRLWIDAICINQDDINERGHHVSMMADVFRNATKTIAYVGESDEHSAYLALKPDWPGPRERMYEARHLSLTPMTSTKYEYWHVGNFVSRSWFTRTWVIQKVLLSRALEMQAGDDKIDFGEVCTLLEKLQSESNFRGLGITRTFMKYGSEGQVQTRLRRRFAGVDGMEDLAEADASRKGYLKYWQLFNFMMETSVYKCRDGRDKLFALFSLFEGEPPEELRPDYSLDVGEVYANIARYFILSEGITLGLSAAVGIRAFNIIPTWAIDWRDSLSLEKITTSNMGDRTQYTAGFVPGPHSEIPAIPSEGRILRLRGIRAAMVHCYKREWPVTLGNSKLSQPKVAVRFATRDAAGKILYGGPKTEPNWYLPDSSQSDDVIVVFVGFEVPFVLRASEGRWLLVGECDVEELMYRQAFDGPCFKQLRWDQIDADEPPIPLEDFELV